MNLAGEGAIMCTLSDPECYAYQLFRYLLLPCSLAIPCEILRACGSDLLVLCLDIAWPY